MSSISVALGKKIFFLRTVFLCMYFGMQRYRKLLKSIIAMDIFTLFTFLLVHRIAECYATKSIYVILNIIGEEYRNYV